MKIRNGVLLIATVFLIMSLSGPARAEWEFQRLSDNSGYSGGPDIAASGSNVHVVWTDNTFGNNDIFYKGSTDGGNSWRFRRLSNNPGSSTNATIALIGTSVHVVWSDTTYGHTGELFYRRSTDNGNTWDHFARITDNIGFSRNPDLIAFDGSLYLVWEDNSFGDFDILLKLSYDNGDSWPYERFTHHYSNSYNPTFAITEVGVYDYWTAVWEGTIYTGENISFKRDANDGIHEDFLRLSNNTGVSEYPVIATYGSNIHVLWQDDTFGSYRVFDLFYKRSTDGGLNWTFQRFTDNSGISKYPDIGILENIVHIVWDDATYNPPAPEIFWKWSPNNGVTWYFDRLSDNSGYSTLPKIAVTGATDDVQLYVVWQDNTYGNYEIFFKRGP